MLPKRMRRLVVSVDIPLRCWRYFDIRECPVVEVLLLSTGIKPSADSRLGTHALIPNTTPPEHQTSHFDCHHQPQSDGQQLRPGARHPTEFVIGCYLHCWALLCSVMCQPPSHVVCLTDGVVTDRLAARGCMANTFGPHSLSFSYAMNTP